MLRRDDLMNGYTIWQDTELFCFGIDAVLLAHYPALKGGDRILDLGCGFAPIPLILHAEARKRGLLLREGSGRAGKSGGIHITGLELQDAAAQIARRSVIENGLERDIDIVTGDILEAGELFAPASFSLITCNPPYMPASDGLRAEKEARAIARTELCCTLEDVIRAASRLLKLRGRFALVHRPFRLPELFRLLGAYHLEPKRMRLVYPDRDAKPSMVLMEAVKGGRPHLVTEPPLLIYEKDRSYTKEIYRIYGWDTVPGGNTDRES